MRREIPPRVGSDRSPVALCLEPHDLVLAKCAAGREKDWGYARAALEAGLVQVDTLLARVSDLPVDARVRHAIERNLGAIATATGLKSEPPDRATRSR